MADTATHTPAPLPSLFGQRRQEGWGPMVLALLFAFGMHAGAGVAVQRAKVAKPPVRVQMAIVKKETPKPPPPPPEEKKEEPKKEPPPKKIIAKAPVKQETPKEPPAPPPPNSEPPKDPPKKPVPIVSGVTLESTVEGPSNFAVAVGNTMYADPNKNKLKPNEVQKYGAPAYREAPAPKETGGTNLNKGPFKPVPKFSVSTEPEVTKEVKAAYPQQAKTAGIEGVVELRVEIWQDGTVRSVKVVRGLGYGLDEAAVEAMRQFLFKPATVDGEPVQYIIPRYMYRFDLEG